MIFAESLPNLSSLRPRQSERLAQTLSLSPKNLKRKVMSEDRLLQTLQLPPHHLRHSNSSKKLLAVNQQLFGQRKTVAQELEELSSKRREVELVLEQSVREIFSEISHRKLEASHFSSTRYSSFWTCLYFLTCFRLPSMNKTASPDSFAKSRSRSSRGAENKREDHRLRVDPQIKSQGGITGLGLDDFSDNNRFAAIIKFLANPSVFHQVRSIHFYQ